MLSIHWFFGMGIDLVVLTLMPSATASAKSLRLLAWFVPFSIFGTISALLAWSAANAIMLRRHAEALATDRPYCIQVAGNYLGHYQEANSVHALSGLKMQTPYTNGGGSGDYQFAFHAVLVIDTRESDRHELYNWSYRSNAFLAISDRSRGYMKPIWKPCKTRSHFIGTLPWLAPDP